VNQCPNTEPAMHVGNGAIWPEIAGKEEESGGKKGGLKRCKSQQKKMEISKLLASLLQPVQCIVPRKTGQ